MKAPPIKHRSIREALEQLATNCKEDHWARHHGEVGEVAHRGSPFPVNRRADVARLDSCPKQGGVAGLNCGP